MKHSCFRCCGDIEGKKYWKDGHPYCKECCNKKTKINPYRQEMNSYAKSKGICTQCFSKPSASGRVQCQPCIDRNRNKRIRRNK